MFREHKNLPAFIYKFSHWLLKYSRSLGPKTMFIFRLMQTIRGALTSNRNFQLPTALANDAVLYDKFSGICLFLLSTGSIMLHVASESEQRAWNDKIFSARCTCHTVICSLVHRSCSKALLGLYKHHTVDRAWSYGLAISKRPSYFPSSPSLTALFHQI